MNQIEMEELKKRLASRISYNRTKNGFTQEEFAEIMGISVQTLRNYESGKTVPSGEFLAKAERVLKVSLDFLMSKSWPDNVPTAAELFHDSQKIDKEEYEEKRKVILKKYMEMF